MTKSDKLLKESFEYLDLLTFTYPPEEFSRIRAHMEDTRNYLNRRIKLVVGSEWVCDVGCYASQCDTGVALTVAKGFHAKVLNIGSYQLIFEYPDGFTRYITIDQFLACFVPKEVKE